MRIDLKWEWGFHCLHPKLKFFFLPLIVSRVDSASSTPLEKHFLVCYWLQWIKIKKPTKETRTLKKKKNQYVKKTKLVTF